MPTETNEAQVSGASLNDEVTGEVAKQFSNDVKAILKSIEEAIRRTDLNLKARTMKKEALEATRDKIIAAFDADELDKYKLSTFKSEVSSLSKATTADMLRDAD